MEPTNAFIGKKEQPSPQELAAALGPAAGLWTEFVAWMANQLGVATEEWKGAYAHKYGWSLILQQKKRRIIYLSPCNRCFRASFTLSDKAVELAKAARLPQKIQQALIAAPRYPEGTGLRLVVKNRADLGPVCKLAEIKLAH